MLPSKDLFIIGVVFWGRWHTDAFIKIELPSLLSAGNLPAIAATCRIEFRILTTPSNRRDVESARAFAELKRFAQVTIIEEEDFSADRRFPIHHRFWNDCIASARDQGAKLFLLPPDLCFSDGSMKEIARRLLDGKAAVYVTGIRVASETFIPAVCATFYPEEGPWKDLTWRDLDALTIEHSHPFNNAVYRKSPHSPHIAEMILYPVGSIGWVKHCYLAGPIMFLDPSRATMTASQVVTAVPAPGDFDVVYDIRQAGFVSLSPMSLYGDWYIGDGPESDFRKAWKQGIRYKSFSSEGVARDLFKLGGDDNERNSPAWAAAEQEARRDAGAIRTRSALIELAEACHRYGLTTMKRLFGLVAIAGKPSFNIASDFDYVCILPDDESLPLDRAEAMIKSEGLSGVADFLGRHIFRVSAEPRQAEDMQGNSVPLERDGDRVMIAEKVARRLGTIGNLSVCRQTIEQKPAAGL